MATGDPILIGNANYGSVGFGDSTILSADAAGALESVLLVEPINQGSGNAIVGRSWSAGPAGGWAVAALGDQVWSDGLWTMGRTAILAQGNEFGAVVSGDDAVTASGRLSGVRASASGPDDFGQTAGVGVVSSGALTGVDATGGTTGVAGRGPAVGVQGSSEGGIAVQGVSQTGTGVVAQGAVGVAAEASGIAVQATATGAGATAVSAAAEQGTAIRAWSESGRALDARSETGDALYVTAGRVGVAAWSEQASGVMGSCSGPNPLGIFRAGVMGQSDTYPGVMGRSDSGDGVEAVTATGVALRAHADGGGTGAYVTAAANPATGTPGLPLLVAATPTTGVTPHPQAALFVGSVGIIGDLVVVGGAKSAAVVAPDGEHRRIYCTEMPEAWIEDAGEVELVDGKAEVAIDPLLAAIADVESYQVFLSPYAPVHAYVNRRDAGSFQIRVAGAKKGAKPVACGWRLLARRSDVTAERFAPYVAATTGPVPEADRPPLRRIDLGLSQVAPHPRLDAPPPVAAPAGRAQSSNH